MDIKNIALATAISLSPLASSSTKVHDFVKNKKMELVKELTKPKEEPNSVYTFSSKDLLSLDSLDFLPTTVISRPVKDLLKTPLAMPGTMKHIWEYLGYNQYQTIMKKYNEKYQWGEKRIGQLDTISFPMIYDEISTAVPHDMKSYLQLPKFNKYRNKLENLENLLVVAKDAKGKYMLLYFKNQKLFIWSYASIGKGTSTPKWVFEIQKKIPKKRSSKYNNAPMPYSLYITQNIFSHQGKVTWGKISHGCIRLPWCYQELLYFSTKEKTKIVIAE